jgi:hypothetical protein
MHVVASLITVVLAGAALAGGTVQSGPQPGEKVPGPFKPLNINGPEAGQKACLYCRYGCHPVVMVFAQEVTPALRTFIQRLEAVTAAHSDCSMGSCVIVCTDSENVPGQLAELARQDHLAHLILAVYKAGGPPAYKLAPDADLTILLYTQMQVVINHSFRKGEFTEQAIDTILADVPQILSAH